MSTSMMVEDVPSTTEIPRWKLQLLSYPRAATCSVSGEFLMFPSDCFSQ